jgi:hypothetical protein
MNQPQTLGNQSNKRKTPVYDTRDAEDLRNQVGYRKSKIKDIEEEVENLELYYLQLEKDELKKEMKEKGYKFILNTGRSQFGKEDILKYAGKEDSDIILGKGYNSFGEEMLDSFGIYIRGYLFEVSQ